MEANSERPAPGRREGAGPKPGYGFGKRLKTALVSALITSLAWGVVAAIYWPRGEAPVAALAEFHGADPALAGNRAVLPPPPGETGTFGVQAVYVPPRGGLTLPVQDVMPEQLTDTYSQTRGDGTRGHNAIDIPAPRGTPVFAAAAGTVVKLFLSKDGGNTVYERSPDGKAIYYYAHLDSYAPGLTEGMAITPGQVLGFVGSTGDADLAAPHLHFAITALAPGEGWWQGQPVNPYPLLAGS